MRLVVSFNTGNPDHTYYLQPPALWSAGEIASAILCGCMPATAAFFNHVCPKLIRKWGSYLRPSNTPSKIGHGNGVLPPPPPVPPRSSWRAPRAWNESYLLRSEGSEGEGMQQQVSQCSDEEAREKVEEHLQWSGWRR